MNGNQRASRLLIADPIKRSRQGNLWCGPHWHFLSLSLARTVFTCLGRSGRSPTEIWILHAEKAFHCRIRKTNQSAELFVVSNHCKWQLSDGFWNERIEVHHQSDSRWHVCNPAWPGQLCGLLNVMFPRLRVIKRAVGFIPTELITSFLKHCNSSSNTCLDFYNVPVKVQEEHVHTILSVETLRE